MPADKGGGNRKIFTDNGLFRQSYHSLRLGDVFIGRLRLKTTEEHLLLDLAEKGVILFPSGLSQCLCRSKIFQAQIYTGEMLPHTRPVHDQHDMLEALNRYQQHAITRVITKHDRKNAGQGIHLWADVEDVYNQSTLGTLPFPFVLQPFAPDCRDIRVIVLGGYQEAYSRKNPHNFRNNLHCGGQSAPCTLTPEQHALCRRVMERGKFPYAHIDLMVTGGGDTFLAEINLRGGIKGAAISPAEYRKRIEEIHHQFRMTC